MFRIFSKEETNRNYVTTQLATTTNDRVGKTMSLSLFSMIRCLNRVLQQPIVNMFLISFHLMISIENDKTFVRENRCLPLLLPQLAYKRDAFAL